LEDKFDLDSVSSLKNIRIKDKLIIRKENLLKFENHLKEQNIL
jgi:hypothetical protein